MLLRKLRRPSPAFVLASIALFVALGGTGYAALKLPKNSVGSEQIKKRAVTTAKLATRAVTRAKLANGAVTGAKVRQGSLTASDFRQSSLPSGPTGPAGPPGPPGPPQELPRVGSVVLSDAHEAQTAAGPTELGRFTTTAPGKGALVVSVEGTLWHDLDAPGAASVTAAGELGVCSATATLASASCGEPLDVWTQDADNSSAANTTEPFAVTRVVPVSAGATTLYLNAANYGPAGSTFGMWNAPTVTAIWTPDSAALPVVEGP